jgi:hypothetical protein
MWVSINGGPAVTFTKPVSGLNVTVGVYTQSSVSKGDAPTAYGEAIHHALKVNHV